MAGPLADAGPYEYDLPVARGGGQPAPSGSPANQDARLPRTGKLAGLFWIVATYGLNEWSGWPLLNCYAAMYCVFTIFSYWDTPKPRQGFLRWTLKVVGIFLNFFIALVTMPQSLRGLLPDWWAFALPTFVCILIFHWVPPLTQNARSTPLWQWALRAAAFAALWGWAGPAVVK